MPSTMYDSEFPPDNQPPPPELGTLARKSAAPAPSEGLGLPMGFFVDGRCKQTHSTAS